MPRAAATNRLLLKSNQSCMQFAGNTGSRILLNSLSAYSFIQNTAIFFVGAWVRPTVLGSQQRTILGNNATAVTEAGIIFAIAATSGVLRCQLTGSNQQMINASTSAALRIPRDRMNKWTHIGVTGNGSQLTFYMYDGTFKQETNINTISVFGSGNSTFPLMLGVCNGASLSSPFGGMMDDIVISSKNWTFAEYQDWVVNNNRPATGRVTFLELNEGSGPTQTDTDGRQNGANTGTIYNAVEKFTALRSASAARSASAVRSIIS